MKKLLSIIWVAAFVFATHMIALAAPPSDAILVGRISYVGGNLLRYVPEGEDWVLTVQDSPAGPKDAFYTDENGKAEFMFPNNSLIRLRESTQLEIAAVRNDLTQIYLTSGLARFYSKGPDTVVRAETPFGYVVAPPGTRFDLYVGDESVEIICLHGFVNFIQRIDGVETRHEVSAGSPPLLADRGHAEPGAEGLDPKWDQWNTVRDNLLAKKEMVRTEYLPESLQGDAYALQDYGRWDRVYYLGAYHYFWHPVRVAVGWSPFTYGRWTVWYGEHVWIPYEPFGYVTHHFGDWVFLGGFWYWVPPRVVIGRLLVHWHPGRVGWFYTDRHVGWVPLAPHETYYGRHYWGPNSVVITNANIRSTQINIHRYANVQRSVIVDKADFYAGHKRYNTISGVDKTRLIKEARPAPVIQKSLIQNVTNVKNQYKYTTVEAERKPNRIVTNQIRTREREEKVENAATLMQDVRGMEKGRVEREGKVKPPQVTNRMVNAEDVNKPPVQSPQKKIMSRPQTQSPSEEFRPKTEPRKPLRQPMLQPRNPEIKQDPTIQGQSSKAEGIPSPRVKPQPREDLNRSSAGSERVKVEPKERPRAAQENRPQTEGRARLQMPPAQIRPEVQKQQPSTQGPQHQSQRDFMPEKPQLQSTRQQPDLHQDGPRNDQDRGNRSRAEDARSKEPQRQR